MNDLFINNNFIIVNEHDSNYYVVKKFPYQKFTINQDSFKILEIIQTNDGLPNEEEPLAPHIVAFLNQLLDFGILTRDKEQRGHANVKTVKTNPICTRIFFEVTPQCNLQCQHCFNMSDINTQNEDQLSTDEVKLLIDQVHDLGIWQFDLTGGELFLREDIFDILEYLDKKGMAVVLFSNLTLLDGEKIKKLKELKIRKVVTSLDGFSDEIHDGFRGVKGSLKKTVTNIKSLQENGIDFSINVMLGDHNHSEIDQLIDYLRFDLKAPYIADVIMPIGRGKEMNTAEDYAIRMGYVNYLRDKEARCQVNEMANFDVPPQKPCGVGESFMYITYEGSINLCTSLNYRFSEEFRFGNVRKDELNEVWTNRMAKFRGLKCEKHLSCPAKEKCKGGCRSRAYSVYGSIQSPDKVYCKMYGCE